MAWWAPIDTSFRRRHELTEALPYRPGGDLPVGDASTSGPRMSGDVPFSPNGAATSRSWRCARFTKWPATTPPALRWEPCDDAARSPRPSPAAALVRAVVTRALRQVVVELAVACVDVRERRVDRRRGRFAGTQTFVEGAVEAKVALGLLGRDEALEGAAELLVVVAVVAPDVLVDGDVDAGLGRARLVHRGPRPTRNVRCRRGRRALRSCSRYRANERTFGYECSRAVSKQIL